MSRLGDTGVFSFKGKKRVFGQSWLSSAGFLGAGGGGAGRVGSPWLEPLVTRNSDAVTIDTAILENPVSFVKSPLVKDKTLCSCVDSIFVFQR